MNPAAILTTDVRLVLCSDVTGDLEQTLTWAQGPLLRELAHTRVVLTLPHSFADGMSYRALHQRLWTIYTALRTNQSVPADPGHHQRGHHRRSS